ncbi:hypothetical protein MMC21_006905 [Puttea exsequens]|nr:hypothetical protein [Puttea exsequens]
MVLELYVWGPAFSLPSIDPQCLATIAYFQLIVPAGSWILIASTDTTTPPTKELPYLIDGPTTTSGFSNIINHLSTSHSYTLDAPFTPLQLADITAFTSHATTTLAPLLSLSLYASSLNYALTRSAYTPLLPWPTQYTIPPSQRARALAQTAHLGISPEELNATESEDDASQRKTTLTSILPTTLTPQPPTLSTTLTQHSTRTHIRLSSLIDITCHPLAHLLSQNQSRYLLSPTHPSSLDCLVLAHLALALLPALPQRWLAQGLEERWPGLCAYVRSGVRAWFGREWVVEDAMAGKGKGGRREEGLPWRSGVEQRGIGHMVAGSVIRSVRDSLPGSSHILTSNTTTTNNTTPTPSSSSTSLLYPTLVAATGAFAAVAGYALYNILKPGPEPQKLSDMGEAGAVFAGLEFGSGTGRGKVKRREREREMAVEKEMDVEVEVEDGVARHYGA